MPHAASSSSQQENPDQIMQQVVELLAQLENPQSPPHQNKLKKHLFHHSKKDPRPYEQCRDLIKTLWQYYQEANQPAKMAEVLERVQQFNRCCGVKNHKFQFNVAAWHIRQLSSQLLDKTPSEASFTQILNQLKADLHHTKELSVHEKGQILKTFAQILEQNTHTYSNHQRSEFISMFNLAIERFDFETLKKTDKKKVLDGYAKLFIHEFIRDYTVYSQLSEAQQHNSIIKHLTESIDPEALLRIVLHNKKINDFLDDIVRKNPRGLLETLNQHMDIAAYGYNNALKELIQLRNRLKKQAAASSSQSSEWRMRTRTEQAKLIIHSYDFDGCTGVKFIPLNAYARPDILMIGSTRQSQTANSINKHSISQKEDAFHMLVEWANQFNIQFSPQLYADIVNRQPLGTAFFSRKNYDFEKHFDETKVSLLFTQMWAMALEHSNDSIDFHFFDDREEILFIIKSFYQYNQDLIPENLNLHLHHHAPTKNIHRDLGLISGSGALKQLKKQKVELSTKLYALLRQQKLVKNHCKFIKESKPQRLYFKIMSALSLTEDTQQFTDAYKQQLQKILEKSPYPHYQEDIKAVRTIVQQRFETLLQNDICQNHCQKELLDFLQAVDACSFNIEKTATSEDFAELLNRILKYCQSDMRIEPQNIILDSAASSSASSSKRF